jgi:hypothetical protein
VDQTQPIKMPWCALRLLRQTRRPLRGACTRENALDGDRCSRHHDFADHAWGAGLPLCKRALGPRLAQQGAQGLGMLHHGLPMDARRPRLRSLATFLGTLVQLRSTLLTPCLQRLEREKLGLRGIESAWGLPLEPWAPLDPRRGWGFEPGEGVLCGVRPRLLQVRPQGRRVEPRPACVPANRIEPIRPHELGGARGRAAHAQRRVALAVVIEGCGLLADALVADAPQAQPALAAVDERAEPIPTCRRRGPLPCRGRVAWPGPLRFVPQRDAETGWRVAPDPCALRALAAPRLAILAVVCLRLPLSGEPGRPILVTRLTGIDPGGQESAARRRVPAGGLARGGARFGGVQALGDLRATPLFCHPRTRDVVHDGGCHGIAHPLRCAAVPCRQRAGAVTRGRPTGCTPPAALSPTVRAGCARPSGRARPPRSALASGATACPGDYRQTDAGERSRSGASFRPRQSGAMDAPSGGPGDPGTRCPRPRTRRAARRPGDGPRRGAPAGRR